MAAAELYIAAVASFLAGCVGIVVSAVAYRDLEVPGARTFARFSVVVTGWCFATAALYLAAGFVQPDESSSRLLLWGFERVVRVFGAVISPLVLVFVLRYAGHDRWLQPRWLALVWVPPAVYVVLSVTAPLHGFATTPADVQWVTANGITAPLVPAGPLESTQLFLGYTLSGVAIAVLARLVLRSRTTSRRQLLGLAAAIVVPTAATITFHLGVRPHPAVDFTAPTFVLAWVALWYALFNAGLLRVTPMPGNVVVEELTDPVLVLDDEDRIVDRNPAAARALDIEQADHQPVSQVAPDLAGGVTKDEMYVPTGGGPTEGGPGAFYAPQSVTLEDQHGADRGRLVVLRDVTGQKRRQSRLEALQSATQQFIAATTEQEIADLAVDFAERAMTPHSAGIFLANADGTELHPVAVTADVEDHFEASELVLGPEDPLFHCFEEGTQQTVDPRPDSPFERYAVYPMGPHGVLVVGSQDDDDFAADDVQFASILARTTQVALTQVERERELRRSRAAIERRTEQVEFFNGILRHSLRNALLVIRGRTGFVREAVDDEVAIHLDRIDQWCDDLAALTEEIRAINETVTASEAERLDVVDLSTLVRERTREIAADQKAADLSLDVPPGIDVQANHLAGKVLDSVLLNAIEHHDGDQPRVQVTAVQSDDWVQVRIADDGPGMPEELKETVFERDVAASQTSKGFGLYFVSVMMGLYGGRVWFEDNEPRGTVAVLEFQTPADDDEPSPVGSHLPGPDSDAIGDPKGTSGGP